MNVGKQILDNLVKEYKELYCPMPNCKAKFPAPWDKYEVGKNDKGLMVYKCPVCGNTFTADNMSVNALKVGKLEKSIFVWLDKNTNEIVFRVHSDTIFTDGSDYYIHVPVMVLNNINLRMFSVSDDVSDDDIIRAFVSLTNKEKLKRKGK